LSRNELNSNVVSLESERDCLVTQKSSLESAFELFRERIEALQDEKAKALSDRVAELDDQLLEMAIHLDEEFYPRFLTTISGQRWFLSHGLKLVILKCLQSPEYLQALGQYVDDVNALSAVNFSLLSELESKKDASIVDLMDSLCLEGVLAEIHGVEDLQPSPAQLMLPIHRQEDNVVFAETFLSSSLEIVKPLSSKSLTGETSTSAAPITTFSTTYASSVIIPRSSVVINQVLVAEPHSEDPPPMTFEKEELSTYSE
ncbi:hypothetical protein Tco_1573480, partial [Tanacetum coccineum]